MVTFVGEVWIDVESDAGGNALLKRESLKPRCS